MAQVRLGFITSFRVGFHVMMTAFCLFTRAAAILQTSVCRTAQFSGFYIISFVISVFKACRLYRLYSVFKMMKMVQSIPAVLENIGTNIFVVW